MRWLVVLALVASGCTQTGTQVCQDGTLCPAGRPCDNAHGGCVSPEQVTACTDLEDGASCTIDDVIGVCDQGVCLGASCGDGFVTSEEACDDGNNIDEDGCRGDCLSSEMCGNGVLDEHVGEQCDCGTDALSADCVSLNSDMPGASCKENCTLHCGDGEVNSAEDCDTRPKDGGCLGFGFDHGPLGCSAFCANDFARCGDFGITTLGGPGLEGKKASRIWVSPTGDVFIAGSSSRAVYQDETWTPRRDNAFVSWAGISGATSDFVIAVGSSFGGVSSQLAVARWDGQAWSNFPAPPAQFSFSSFNDVVVTSPSDIVAVGFGVSSPPTRALVWEHDGADWVQHLANTDGALFAIALVGAGPDLVGVGEGGLVVRRSGGVWSSERIAASPDLLGVWAASATEMVAVGASGEIFRFDGQWRQEVSLASGSLSSVVGLASDDIYAAGDGGVFHYDGRGWFPIALDSTQSISTVSMADGKVLAAGLGFTLSSFEAGGWGQTQLGTTGLDVRLSGASDVVYASSFRSLHRYNGVAPELDLVVLPAVSITALDARTATDVYFAAGSSVYRFDGVSEVEINTATVAATGLWAAGPGHVFVSHRNGALQSVREIDGATVVDNPIALASSNDLLIAITGVGARVYTVSRDGEVWSNASGEWALELDLGVPATSIWAADDGTVFVGGFLGTIWRYDGAQWLPLLVETAEQIIAIHGSSSEDVFATTLTTLQHFDGQRVSPVNRRDFPLSAVFTTSNSAYFFERTGKLSRLKRPEPW